MIELNGKPFGDMRQSYGGDTLNTAIYLSRILSSAGAIHYVTALGEDALSHGMLSAWRAEGLDTSMVLSYRNRQPGLYLVQLDDAGERTFMYWRNESAARFLLQHVNFSVVAQQLSSMDAILLSGISLAILPAADRQSLLELLAALSQQGVTLIFDTNYRPALWSAERDSDVAKRAYQDILAISDVALATFDDEQLLWGDASPTQALQRLQRSGVKKAVVRVGAKGCWYQDFAAEAQSARLAPITQMVDIVDATAAGDAFNAGFLAGYLFGKGNDSACALGHQLAGIVMQHTGAIAPLEATRAVARAWESA